MSKYKVGDKVVLEITDKIEVTEEPWYILSDATSIFESHLDKAAEPLSTYTEPLERKNENKQKQIEKLVDKLHRQAAEITRLLEENMRLKPNYENIRAEGQNEAWELAKKIVDDVWNGGYSEGKLEQIFGCAISQLCIVKNTYSEAAAKVAQWEKAKAKPQKTILMDLLEKLPNIETEVDGLPKFCPFALGYDVLCSSKKTCKECWNRPLEQIGEE